jgi:hypothetical protein
VGFSALAVGFGVILLLELMAALVYINQKTNCSRKFDEFLTVCDIICDGEVR